MATKTKAAKATTGGAATTTAPPRSYVREIEDGVLTVAEAGPAPVQAEGGPATTMGTPAPVSPDPLAGGVSGDDLTEVPQPHEPGAPPATPKWTYPRLAVRVADGSVTLQYSVVAEAIGVDAAVRTRCTELAASVARAKAGDLLAAFRATEAYGAYASARKVHEADRLRAEAAEGRVKLAREAVNDAITAGGPNWHESPQVRAKVDERIVADALLEEARRRLEPAGGRLTEAKARAIGAWRAILAEGAATLHREAVASREALLCEVGMVLYRRAAEAEAYSRLAARDHQAIAEFLPAGELPD